MNVVRKIFIASIAILFLSLAAQGQDVLVYKSFNPNASCVDPSTYILNQMNSSFTQGMYKCVAGLPSPLSLSSLIGTNQSIYSSDYAVGNGTTNDTVGLQTMIDLAISSGRPIQLAGNTHYLITATLNIVNVASFKMTGTNPASALAETDILWGGTPGGTVLLVDRCFRCEIGNFRITDGTPGSGSRTIGVGIDIDDLGAGVISTGNYFHDIGIYNATTGMRLSNVSTANNDLHIFERMDIRLDPVTAGTTGVIIDDTQSKYHTFRNTNIGFANRGIQLNSGSFNSYSGGFSNNNVDNYFVETTEPVSFYSPQSETAGRFIETTAPGVDMKVNVFGGRLSPDARHADGNYIYINHPSTVGFYGVQLSTGTLDAGWRAFFQGSTTALVSRGHFEDCSLPNNSFVAGSATLQSVSWENCTFTNSGNNLLANKNAGIRMDGGQLYMDSGDLFLQTAGVGGVSLFSGGATPIHFHQNGFITTPQLRPDTGGVAAKSIAIQAYNGSSWQTVFSATNAASGNIDAVLTNIKSSNNGTAAAPAFSFSNALTTGWSTNGSGSGGHIIGTINGTDRFTFAGGILSVTAGTPIINLLGAGSAITFGNPQDVGVFRTSAGLLEVNNGTSGTWRDLKVRQHYIDATITASGTTGNQTINKAAGTVNVAAAGTTVTVTNSLVTANSLVFAIIRTNDTTCRMGNVVPGAGTFTINLTAACAAEISIGFHVINQ